MRHQHVSRGALTGEVLAFVFESEQRVVAHCDRLLGAADLPEQDRNRLLSLRRREPTQADRRNVNVALWPKKFLSPS